MKVFFDCEFLDDGTDVDLLSIGLVRADGQEYYAEVEEAPWEYAEEDSWLKENVFPHLTGNRKPQRQIAKEIIEFVGKSPTFWAYFADWDWMLLIRLCSETGRLVDAPEDWPHLCLDLKQLQIHLGRPPFPPHSDQEHNALADARWNRNSYKVLTEYAGRQRINLVL